MTGDRRVSKPVATRLLMGLPPTRFYYLKIKTVLCKNKLNVDLVFLLPAALFSFSNDCINY